MEPSPPRANGNVSRFLPREPAHATSNHAPQWDGVAPGLTLHQQPRRHHHHHHHAKVSPRHIKLQSVHATAPLPIYATATLPDQIQGHFRNELFQLHQLLQDAVASCVSANHPHPHARHPKSTDAQLTSEIERSRTVFELLTSDRHAAVMREFFVQWQHLHADKAASTRDEQELLCQVVDVLFRNLPTVLTDSDVHNPKEFMRFVDSLKMMRELVLSLLYKAPEKKASSGSDEDEVDTLLTPPASGLFASTSALLAASRGGIPKTTQRVSHRSSAPTKRVPVYLYCQQLEHEIETLQRRLHAVGHRHTHSTNNSDVGLLHEQTLSLLVQFWELPRRERLAFFCQVASQAKPVDCDTVLRVFLDKCDTNNLVSIWDALQVTPHVQHALAMRKHGEDVEAAAREAAEAFALASRQDGERHQKHGSGSSSDGGSGGDESTPKGLRAGRRGKRFAVAARGGNRPSQRQVDLGGLTEVFERGDELDEDDESGEGGWGVGGGKRRRRKLRIHDRVRTPDSPRAHHNGHGAKHSEKRRTRLGDPVASLLADTSTPATPKPILERLHSNLLELLKADDPDLDTAVSDAAWKLVESIDHRAKRHNSVVPRKLSTLPQHAGAVPLHSSLSSAVPLRGVREGDPLDSSLTVEQQYFVKLDQLQSLLASLGSVSVLAMSTDAISSAFKRLPALLRLFQGFQNQVNTSVGLDPSPVSSSFQAASLIERKKTNAMAVADMGIASPLVSADDDMIHSVEVMLGKLGRMVRSLAPMADVGTMAVTSASNTLSDAPMPTASSEILKLAEAMEDIASSVAAPIGAERHHLSLDPAKRMAVLSRLKSLAHSTQIENLTGLLSSTCDDIVSLKAVSQHQQLQLQALSADNEFLTDDLGVNDDGVHGPSGSGDGDVDDVLKLVKKAKTRRASAAKLAASTTSAAVVSDSDDDDDQSLLMNPMTAPRYANRVADISLTLKQAAAQRGSKLFNAGILLRVVDQMYREHFETMAASLQYGSRRMEFSEFMYDWHIRKYGLKSLAQQHLLKLIQSLRKHERKVFPCHLCLRFLGVLSPLGFHEHKFVLGLLDKWSNGSFSGAAKHRVEFVPRQFKVRVVYAISTIQEALSERFGVYFRSMDAVATRIKALAMRQDEEFIKESDALTVAIDEWQAQRRRIEQILDAVYTAGDANGDGSLEFDEFSAVMSHLSPSLSDAFVQRVFTAAHDYLKPRRISFARFLDVVLLERVLNTTINTTAKGKPTAVAASGGPSAAVSPSASSVATGPSMTSGTDDEELYQFKLLEETWAHDRDVVAQALSAIPHEQTVASLQFRVAFLTQILTKRVDAKTAWMCHRQIMREIGRYQHLDGTQIVEVKTKEESFKRAVLAIRNMQRLSLAFRRASEETKAETPSLADEEQVTASTSEDPGSHRQTSYVSVVEDALLDGGAASQVEMEALEDQIREKFLERADETAIDDFKSALRTIRRQSVQAFTSDPELDRLRAANGRTGRLSLTLGDVLEEGEAEDGDEDYGDDEEEEEEDTSPDGEEKE